MEENARRGHYGFDSCGALDLSSGSSAGTNSTKVSDAEESDYGGNDIIINGKRSSDHLDLETDLRKRFKNELDQAEHSQPKVINKRKNIRQVFENDKLTDTTKEAKVLEEERLQRLKNHQSHSKEELIFSSDSDENKVSDQSDVIEEDDDDDDDPNNSGMHVNDGVNVPDDQGRVLVNVHHPREDQDIHLAPQLAAAIKPHQIGGVRFLYDNIVESVSRLSSSPGYGCILAHSMGLGKTMQIVSFIDVFLSLKTSSDQKTRSVLCIVPINTIQNWLAEFNFWMPAKGDRVSEGSSSLKYRDFSIYVLNDNYKNLNQRAGVISEWGKTGGVLMLGYELYRQLANKKPRKRKSKGFDDQEEKQERRILADIQAQLVSPGPDLVVCDEGHRIKNSHASISQALKQIRTRRRIVMTGYPLQNNLMEYWCMVDWVRPNYLGNKTEFSNMFERPIQNGQCSDSTPKDVRLMKHRAHVLHQQLKGFVQRRGHVVLKDTLPVKTEHVVFVRMTNIQRRLYRRFMEELLYNRCVSNPLKAFAVCCKIWNHPDVLHHYLLKKEGEDLDLDQEEQLSPTPTGSSGRPEVASPAPPSDQLTSESSGGGHFAKKEEINYEWAQGMFNDYSPGEVDNSNKLVIFLGILEESLLCDDRILLFSQSLFTLNLIEEFLKQKKITNEQAPWVNGETYYRLDGSTSSLERERLINSFNSDTKVKLFLVSTRAGSLGVNLVGANRVVIFDASWNPCHDTQAVCRVYRYGQKKETHVYRLVTDYSLEKKIYDRQVNKQGMADRIVDELNPDAHLSTRDVHSLICDDEEESEVADMGSHAQKYSDPVMKFLVTKHGDKLTRPPFAHESLLVDRKDNRLSKAEKRLAEKAYKLERTSKITYSRPSYAAFYPKQGTFATNLNNPGSNGYTRNRYYENGKKIDSWMQNGRALEGAKDVLSIDPSRHVDSRFPVPSFSNVLGAPPVVNSDLNGVNGNQDWKKRDPDPCRPEVSQLQQIVSSAHAQSRSESQPQSPSPSVAKSSSEHNSSGSQTISTSQALEALTKQGVQLQQVKVSRDLSIPTGPSTPPVHLSQGDTVVVIRTGKGIYLRMGEKIIKIKQLQAVQGLFGESEQN